MRLFWLTIHRYSSLFILLFLINASVTGVLLVFYEEIDDWLNRDLVYAVPLHATQPLQSPVALYQSVQEQLPDQSFDRLILHINAGHSVVYQINTKTLGAKKVDYTKVYVNPYTTQIVGYRNPKIWEMRNFMPIVYDLHKRLLFGKTGKLILGIAALIWTLNCFIGFYLTLPLHKKRGNTHAKQRQHSHSTKTCLSKFWKKWRPAWKVRRYSNFFKLNVDLHQATGLWLWGVLFVLAWSSVAFNLPSAYQAVMTPVFDMTPHPKTLKSKYKNEPTQLTMQQALSLTTKLMQQEAEKQSVKIEYYRFLRFFPAKNIYELRARSDRDVAGRGNTRLVIDAVTGKKIGHYFPTGETRGTTITTWLYALHMGQVGGLVYRLFLLFVGLCVFILSFSGGYLWWKGLQRRRKARIKQV